MIHCDFLLKSVSWNTVSRTCYEIANTFMTYFYFSILFDRSCFFLTKKCVYIKKMSFDSEKLVVLDLMNNIYYSKTKNKTKKSKRPKCIYMMPKPKNRKAKVHILK